MKNGVVKFYNEAKGFGFIKEDNGQVPGFRQVDRRIDEIHPKSIEVLQKSRSTQYSLISFLIAFSAATVPLFGTELQL
ncbi:MAG: cold-shock protein [Saprospiraceae bacterium]|nr:cold-shock protein [Candidatus Vicinibacter affinis]